MMLKSSQYELLKAIDIFYDKHLLPSGVLNVRIIESFICMFLIQFCHNVG